MIDFESAARLFDMVIALQNNMLNNSTRELSKVRTVFIKILRLPLIAN